MNDMHSPDYDPCSDPNNPRKIIYEDILAAARRLAGLVVRTPCNKSHMSEKLGMELYFKEETMQYTGSCKERGVLNVLLQLDGETKKNGVITASNGNHGLALAYHALKVGVPCVVVLPNSASFNKVTRCQALLGTRVIVHGANMDDAKLHAMYIAKEKKMMYINGYDHPHVIDGQGSIGIEIVEQVPTVDAVLVPAGGGGLVTGVATALKFLKPDTEIYGIQTDKSVTLTETLRKNDCVHLDYNSTICDGLAISKIGPNVFHNAKHIIDKMIVVNEDWVTRAIMHIVDEDKLVVEGAGAVSVAAVMAGLFPNLKGKKVVCVMSGGNIDAKVLARSLERGMAAEGRLIKFRVMIVDRPGAMAELCSLLSGIGVTLRDVVPERSWVKGDVFSMQLQALVETRGWDHTKELIEQVKKHYKEYVFEDMTEKAKPDVSRRGPCLAPNPVCMQK